MYSLRHERMIVLFEASWSKVIFVFGLGSFHKKRQYLNLNKELAHFPFLEKNTGLTVNVL